MSAILLHTLCVPAIHDDGRLCLLPAAKVVVDHKAEGKATRLVARVHLEMFVEPKNSLGGAKVQPQANGKSKIHPMLDQ